jgi:hypothetical protein
VLVHCGSSVMIQSKLASENEIAKTTANAAE